MTVEQKIKLAMSRVRQRLNEVSGLEGDALTPEIREEAKGLETEYHDLELRHRASVIGKDEEVEVVEDAETREVRRLHGEARVGRYLAAAVEMRSVDGAEHEYAAAVGASGQFPLQLLAPEIRRTTDTDSAANQGTWLDRLFATAAATRVGVTMRSVPAGVASYPVTTAGATGAQQDRQEATADAPWTVGVTELKPKRGSVRAVFSIEDMARLPGLEDALRRDLSMALMDSIDLAIFNGDAGPSTASYDIVGLNTASITESTLTQANKVKGPETLAAFLALVDGIHASSLGDLGIVTSVGANVLWGSTVANAAAENQTVAQFLMASGMSWGTRANIATDTADGDFGAYVGLMRGIEGAAVAAVWEAASMVRDMYTGASTGEVAITLNYLWNFALPRTSNFHRLKFVA